MVGKKKKRMMDSKTICRVRACAGLRYHRPTARLVAAAATTTSIRRQRFRFGDRDGKDLNERRRCSVFRAVKGNNLNPSPKIAYSTAVLLLIFCPIIFRGRDSSSPKPTINERGVSEREASTIIPIHISLFRHLSLYRSLPSSSPLFPSLGQQSNNSHGLMFASGARAAKRRRRRKGRKEEDKMEGKQMSERALP